MPPARAALPALTDTDVTELRAPRPRRYPAGASPRRRHRHRGQRRRPRHRRPRIHQGQSHPQRHHQGPNARTPPLRTAPNVVIALRTAGVEWLLDAARDRTTITEGAAG